MDMKQGENVLQPPPKEDYDVIESIRAEAGNFETLIYPEAYFE
jgi:hypothetical protein